MKAYKDLEALLGGTPLARKAIDAALAEHRQEMAGVVRSFLPRDPDNEADQAVAWALDLAADAVERGQRYGTPDAG